MNLTRISEWLISGIKRGSTWDRVIQRQKTGQSQCRYWKSFELPDKSHLELNGMTHRLAAAWLGFAKLHFESKVKKKKKKILTRCGSRNN